MDLLHQRLQRAPADFAQVPVVVRHELLAVAGAIDADPRPSKVVVGFAQAAIANEGRFGSHGQIRAVKRQPSKQKAAGRRPADSPPSLQQQISRRFLAAVADDVIGEFGAIRQAVHAGFLNCRDMDEHILAASVRLNESITLLPVKPFHCPTRHDRSPLKIRRGLEARSARPASKKAAERARRLRGEGQISSALHCARSIARRRVADPDRPA